MPIPQPQAGENEEDFFDRCMSSGLMASEYPDETQRFAVCQTQWENPKNKESNVKDTLTIGLRKHVVVPFDMKLLKESDEEGTFEGYGAVFNNVDFDGDRIKKGAFKESLAEWKEMGMTPAMFWAHNWTDPIGDWMQMKEDKTGLYVKGKLWLDDPSAKKAHRMMKGKGPKGLSIGFETMESEWVDLDGKRVRDLLKLSLFEVSPVPLAANILASVTSVKNLMLFKSGQLPDKRDIENLLRDAGMSRKQAKAFLAGGYYALRDADMPDEEEGEIASAIDSIIKSMKA